MTPSSNRVLAIIPVQTDYWELSFDVIVEQDFPFWTNILQLTTAEAGWLTIGFRIPAFYVIGRSLGIRFSSEANSDVAGGAYLNLNQKHKIKIWQCGDMYNQFKLRKLVFLDGQLVMDSEHGTFATPFHNVKFFLGDKLYPPAPVRVSNLVYTPDLLYTGTLDLIFLFGFLRDHKCVAFKSTVYQ